MRTFSKILFLIFFLIFHTALSQVKLTDEQKAVCETNARIPSLDKFHVVVIRIYHDYLSSRDWNGLRSVANEVEKGADSIYSSSLPGILRDKKDKWDKAIEDLKVCAANFKTACTGNDTTVLLNSANKIHLQYEFMVKLIQPITKELDAFHVVLYNIYHYYMPNWEIEKLKRAINELAEKKELLITSELRKPTKMTPSRLTIYTEKSEKYHKAIDKLVLEVDNVVKIINTGNEVQIKDAIEKMHSAYQTCEHIFD